MPIEWVVTLALPLLTLVIPAAALGGRRMRGGAVALMAGGALLAFLALWLQGATGVFSGAANPLAGIASIVDACLFLGGLLLALGGWAAALGGWAAALVAAARTRRWSLVALLSLAVYLSSTAFIAAIALTPFGSCLFEPLQPVCASPPLAEQALLAAASLIAPSAILAYALSAPQSSDPERRAQPSGLVASPLSALETLDESPH